MSKRPFILDERRAYQTDASTPAPTSTPETSSGCCGPAPKDPDAGCCAPETRQSVSASSGCCAPAPTQSETRGESSCC